MSSEDWDLYAIVRSCKSAVNTATSVAKTSSGLPDEPMACLASLTVKEEGDHPFTFPINDLSKSCSLQDSQVPSLPQPNLTTTIATNRVIERSFVTGGSSGPEHHQYQMLQRQEVQRSRKRKSQQKRTVCHVTAENLSSDPWAWRKYGQKPIKGSPYPRNYYRCSSSKGCSARKHVERSNSEPNIFIVTYTCDHTHPRPTQRNSLAGSSRNKLSTIENATTSLSPMTPIRAPYDNSAVDVQDTGADGSKDNVALKDKVALEDNVLRVDDDLFKGLEQLIDGGGGDSSSGLGSSWPEFSDSWGTGNSTASGGC